MRYACTHALHFLSPSIKINQFISFANLKDILHHDYLHHILNIVHHAGLRLRNFSQTWIETLTASCPLLSSWVRRPLSKRWDETILPGKGGLILFFLTFGYNPSSLNILYCLCLLEFGNLEQLLISGRSFSFGALVFQNVKSSQKGFQVNGYRRGWHRNKRGEISHSNKLKMSHSYFIQIKTFPSKNNQSKF